MRAPSLPAPRPSGRSGAVARALGVLVLVGAAGSARAGGVGFQLDRYEPTAAGEWFLAVEHPWYSRTRWFAAGLGLDYAHDPLVTGSRGASTFVSAPAAIAHQLVGHLDVAASLFDRVALSATLPLSLAQAGSPSGDVAPAGGVVVGDPRVGLMVRLWGQPEEGPISVHLGASVWFPLAGATSLAGDDTVRGLARVVLAGFGAGHVRWSLDAGVALRRDATLSAGAVGPGATATSALRIGAAAAWTDLAQRFAIGPELVVETSIASPGRAFDADYTGIELLGSAHYHVARAVLFSLGAGLGLLRQPGTPDFRAIARVAYAPGRRDRDHDGVLDADDACPGRPGPRSSDRRTSGCPGDRDGDGVPDDEDRCPAAAAGEHADPLRPGCPRSDRDGDGIADGEDACPDAPAGAHPDPRLRGCPLADRDRDGIADAKDACPDEPAGPTPDPERPGCARRDRDGDGIPDANDLCPDAPAGQAPDPRRPGCPGGDGRDRDDDGIVDAEDRCPDVSAGYRGDPGRPGCPAPDSDGDTVPDAADACPQVPGAPSEDPRDSGCPGLLLIKGGRIQLAQPLQFAADDQSLAPRSLPLLVELATALRLTPGIRKVEIGSHVDDSGHAARDLERSLQRARAVAALLVERGIAAGRVIPRGYGATRPLRPNINSRNRAINRRIELVILSPRRPKADR